MCHCAFSVEHFEDRRPYLLCCMKPRRMIYNLRKQLIFCKISSFNSIFKWTYKKGREKDKCAAFNMDDQVQEEISGDSGLLSAKHLRGYDATALVTQLWRLSVAPALRRSNKARRHLSEDFVRTFWKKADGRYETTTKKLSEHKFIVYTYHIWKKISVAVSLFSPFIYNQEKEKKTNYI